MVRSRDERLESSSFVTDPNYKSVRRPIVYYNGGGEIALGGEGVLIRQWQWSKRWVSDRVGCWLSSWCLESEERLESVCCMV